MAATNRICDRLPALASKDRVSLLTLARVIQRSEGYLRRRLAHDTDLTLSRTERATLARFFGVREDQLGW